MPSPSRPASDPPKLLDAALLFLIPVVDRDHRHRGASVIIVPCANKDTYLDRYARPENGHADRSDAWWPAPYRDIDTGFAALLILLTAVELGLGACFFGLPIERIDAFPEAFGVPEEFRPIGAISVGYPAEPANDISAQRRPEEEVIHR